MADVGVHIILPLVSSSVISCTPLMKLNRQTGQCFRLHADELPEAYAQEW